MSTNLYACPCCGYKTLLQKPPGTYEICHVCHWEDDGVQYYDPDYVGGANQDFSLRIAQKYFLSKFTDKNGEDEILPNEINGYMFEGAKDISNIRRMPIMEIIKIFYSTASDLGKILDLYTGLLQVENSSFVFNYEEVTQILTDEELSDYLILSQRDSYVKSPNGDGRFNELLNLSNEEAEVKMQEIKTIFTNVIRSKLGV